MQLSDEKKAKRLYQLVFYKKLSTLLQFRTMQNIVLFLG